MTTQAESGLDTRPHDLVDALFLAQHDRPGHLVDIVLAELPPELRVFLCHDGTLTTALEAHQLGPVGVDVRAQAQVRLDDTAARLLRAAGGDEATFRRVVIRDRLTGAALVRADSLLLLDRLPGTFPSTLASARRGLGDALARLELESRRELLWCGRSGSSEPPHPRDPRGTELWDGARDTDDAVVRCYRVLTGSLPVLLVRESFPLGWPVRPPARNR